MLQQSSSRAICRALLWKEWREQRWRFLLGAVALSGLLAGMLRAQIIPPGEATLLVYWPIGMVMVIFLAMGPVAGERADGTWEYLLARPVSRADVLRAKWMMGIAQLIGMMGMATLAGMLAMWSRGVRQTFDVVMQVQVARYEPQYTSFAQWSISHPFLWMGAVAMVSTVSLACWYTPLMLILTRARNELTAALGGILLTIALHAWLAQYWACSLNYHSGADQEALLIPALLNPLSPLLFVIARGEFSGRFVTLGPLGIAAILLVYVGIWVVLPLAWMQRRARRGERI